MLAHRRGVVVLQDRPARLVDVVGNEPTPKGEALCWARFRIFFWAAMVLAPRHDVQDFAIVCILANHVPELVLPRPDEVQEELSLDPLLAGGGIAPVPLGVNSWLVAIWPSILVPADILMLYLVPPPAVPVPAVPVPVDPAPAVPVPVRALILSAPPRHQQRANLFGAGYGATLVANAA